jgi:hypothetical protein
MTGPALFIPFADFPGFTEKTRNELFAYAGLPTAVSAPPVASSPEPAPVSSPIEEGPPELTVAMARKLIAAPINPKTASVLRVIAESPTPEFHMKDAIAAAPDTEIHSDLRGAWSGITRRSRKILGDPSADLIWWEGEQIYDGNENYVDHIGRVSPLTHQSLRAALGIRGSE